MPDDDLDQIRSAAAARGTSLQNYLHYKYLQYLRDAVHAQAAYLRRQAALARTAERLDGRPEVPADERRAVLDAIADGHSERADRLIDRPAP